MTQREARSNSDFYLGWCEGRLRVYDLIRDYSVTPGLKARLDQEEAKDRRIANNLKIKVRVDE